MPTHNDSADMKRTRRLFMLRVPNRVTPETNTLQNRKIVIPPITQSVREAMSEVYVHQDEQVTTKKAPYSPGMDVMIPATFARMPIRISQNPVA